MLKAALPSARLLMNATTSRRMTKISMLDDANRRPASDTRSRVAPRGRRRRYAYPAHRRPSAVGPWPRSNGWPRGNILSGVARISCRRLRVAAALATCAHVNVFVCDHTRRLRPRASYHRNHALRRIIARNNPHRSAQAASRAYRPIIACCRRGCTAMAAASSCRRNRPCFAALRRRNVMLPAFYGAALDKRRHSTQRRH